MYRKKQQCDWHMIRFFQRKFGKDAILVFGDHNRGNMKHEVAVRDQNFLETLRVQGSFQCALLDKFRTWSYFPFCDSKVEEFIKRISSRPWQRRRAPMRLMHGLIRCTNILCLDGEGSEEGKLRSRIWNGDLLAVLNFRRVLCLLHHDGSRPLFISRQAEFQDNEIDDELTTPPIQLNPLELGSAMVNAYGNLYLCKD